MSHSILNEQIASPQSDGTRHHPPFEITRQIEQEAELRIRQYPNDRKRSAVLPLLHIVQSEFGFISPEAIGWVAGKLDLALIALPIDENWLEEFELFEDRFVFACAPNNPLTHKKHLEIGDIKDEKLLLLEDGHCLRDQALEVCHKAGWSKSADFQANSLSTLVQMVGAGIGATLLPEMSLEVEARRPDLLKIIPFKNPVPIRRIGMVWRRSSARKSEYRQLAAYLRDRLAPRDEAVVA